MEAVCPAIELLRPVWASTQSLHPHIKQISVIGSFVSHCRPGRRAYTLTGTKQMES